MGGLIPRQSVVPGEVVTAGSRGLWVMGVEGGGEIKYPTPQCHPQSEIRDLIFSLYHFERVKSVCREVHFALGCLEVPPLFHT